MRERIFNIHNFSKFVIGLGLNILAHQVTFADPATTQPTSNYPTDGKATFKELKNTFKYAQSPTKISGTIIHEGWFLGYCASQEVGHPEPNPKVNGALLVVRKQKDAYYMLDMVVRDRNDQLPAPEYYENLSEVDRLYIDSNFQELIDSENLSKADPTRIGIQITGSGSARNPSSGISTIDYFYRIVEKDNTIISQLNGFLDNGKSSSPSGIEYLCHYIKAIF